MKATKAKPTTKAKKPAIKTKKKTGAARSQKATPRPKARPAPKPTPNKAAAPARAPHVKTKKGEKVPAGKTASQLIDQRIADAGGWRAETLQRMRTLILAAAPGTTEEWKWGVPVWSNDGIVCTGEVYTQVVKLTFLRGAAVPDPQRLFNSSLEGATRRAIDIRAGETIDARAFQALVKAAVAANAAPSNKR